MPMSVFPGMMKSYYIYIKLNIIYIIYFYIIILYIYILNILYIYIYIYYLYYIYLKYYKYIYIYIMTVEQHTWNDPTAPSCCKVDFWESPGEQVEQVEPGVWNHSANHPGNDHSP